jgi:L-fuconolactonase
MNDFDRRSFLTMALATQVDRPKIPGPRIPIIDTHIHLFDTTRPEGVPWPPKDDAVLYKPALPARFEAIAKPLGVVGAIEVEASPWLEDNEWVLNLAKKNPILVGTVGDLEPGTKDFPGQLERFHKNPLFRGIRYGNLWNRNLSERVREPAFVKDFRLLARAGLALDSANPDVTLIEAIVRVTDAVPDLRVVVDHLPGLQLPENRAAREAYDRNLQVLGERPQVYVKISQVLQRWAGPPSLDLNQHRQTLDHLWSVFGEDRLLFGSDWPNSDPHATYAEVLSVVRQYFGEKGRAAEEKYFWKNSLAAYRWVKRAASQPR